MERPGDRRRQRDRVWPRPPGSPPTAPTSPSAGGPSRSWPRRWRRSTGRWPAGRPGRRRGTPDAGPAGALRGGRRDGGGADRGGGRRRLEATGQLDILFACAGGSHHMGPMLEADVAAVRATVDLNLIGSFLSLKHAGAAMRATGGGSIVLMSSGAGHFPHRWLWAYGMSKAGIESLCSYAAEELGARRHPGQRRAAGHHRRRADDLHHRRRPAARRLPGPDADRPAGDGGRRGRAPSGSWPGRSRRGSPASAWRWTVATTCAGAPTTRSCSRADRPAPAASPHHDGPATAPSAPGVVRPGTGARRPGPGRRRSSRR